MLYRQRRKEWIRIKGLDSTRNHEGDKIFEAVVKGRKNKIETLVQDALQGGIDAQKVIDESLIPAINHVGVLFDKQIYFLPQLISSAETMETGIGVVEPILQPIGLVSRLDRLSLQQWSMTFMILVKIWLH